MSQVLTPEEMAALLEGLRETEDESGSSHARLPEGIGSRGRSFPEVDQISGCHNLSNWLRVLADSRWPHV